MNARKSVLVLLALMTVGGTASAEFDDAIRKGVAFLRLNAPKQTNNLGYVAISALAIAKGSENKDDPVLQQLVARVAGSVTGEAYQSSDPKYDNYEAAVVIMCLAAVDGDKYLSHITAVTNHILKKQNENGSWDYSEKTTGDVSQTQYAVLGLWEAAGAGVTVPLKVWDKALAWLILHQSTSGAFTYHPVKPDGDTPIAQDKIGHSMTVAGVATMMICRLHLPLVDKSKPAKQRDLLIPVRSISDEEYKATVTGEQAGKAIDAGQRWIASNFTVSSIKAPHTTYNFLHYYIYGLERYASVGELKNIGSSNWYQAGGQFLAQTQSGSGSWNSFNEITDTAFGVLFLGRSTEKTINRIRISTLGKGTMIGGRGMPTAEGAMSIEEARRKARFQRALKVPAGDLLKILDEPDSPNVERAAAALESIDSKELIKAVGGNMQKLRRLTRDERPGVRRGAIWALARTKDYRVVPVLIEALDDPAFLCYQAARDALCYLSRRMDGFGLPAEKQPNAQQLADASKKWKDWFTSLKVQVDPEQEFDD